MVNHQIAGVRALVLGMALSSFWADNAVAYCSEYIVSKNPGPDEFTTICTNTLSQPIYYVSQHFFSDGVSTTLRFSPRTSNILCHEYELGEYVYSSCKAHGIRSSYGEYDPRQSADVEVIPLSQIESVVGDLSGKDITFSSADSQETAEIDQCLVVLKGDDEVYIAFDEKFPLPLAVCLEKFERFVTKQRLFR